MEAGTEDDDTRPIKRNKVEHAVENVRNGKQSETNGFSEMYLETIDRTMLDFDFEKLCSVSLSNLNVYACLVCGRYYQGRGKSSHAMFHSLHEGHHVFINLHTLKIYVLPESYEVTTHILDDIKFVIYPSYSKEQVRMLDREHEPAYDLARKKYLPGYVGLNNIKQNDYINVVIQALSHVVPLRNFCLMNDLTESSDLLSRFGVLVRKLWNPRAFKGHVSPHELIQQISTVSGKKFKLTQQGDPLEFLSWFLNNIHLDLGGSRTKPATSIIHSIFQGKVKVQSQRVFAVEESRHGDRLRFEADREIQEKVVPFLFLTLDLPPPPLFQDELQQNIIPQVSLVTILSKYDGTTIQVNFIFTKDLLLITF